MLQTSLNALNHSTGINKRGACKLIAVPKEGILSMPNTLSLLQNYVSPVECDFWLEEIILKDGYAWLDVSKDVKMNIDFAEEEKVTQQGNLFTYNIPLPIQNDDFTRGKIIRAYDGREWIVAHKQRTGTWRLLGSKERGCTFTAQLNTGTHNKNSNETQCGFTITTADRPFYVLPFLDDADFFEITYNQTTIHLQQIKMNESVIIDWGDGSTGYYPCITGNDNIIEHLYSGTTTRSARVYHLNKSTVLDVKNVTAHNGNITAITGNLPSTLVTLFAQQNLITTLPSGYNIPVPLRFINLSENKLNDTTIGGYLSVLDSNGLSSGAVAFNDQTPAVTPTFAMATFKANLEAKSWTVVY